MLDKYPFNPFYRLPIIHMTFIQHSPSISHFSFAASLVSTPLRFLIVASRYVYNVVVPLLHEAVLPLPASWRICVYTNINTIQVHNRKGIILRVTYCKSHVLR